MQTTADPDTGPAAGSAPDPTETRPVRLLVPAVRRSEYWLSLEDTLHASDLGITRFTEDGELDGMLRRARRIGDFGDDPAGHLVRLRNALRQPRDVGEARQWGLIVPAATDLPTLDEAPDGNPCAEGAPVDPEPLQQLLRVSAWENREEFSGNPDKRLGWWWVYDLDRAETYLERESRYYSDERVIDMKGFARCTLRAYITVKDAKNAGEVMRKMLRDEAFLDEKVREIVADKGGDFTTVKARLLAKVKRNVLKAHPAPWDSAGQSPLWQVRHAMKHGRKRTQLDEWHQFNKVRQTGRPPGSRTRPKAATAV